VAGVRRVAVVTESIACLPKEDAVALGVTVLPVPFEYAGRDYLDGVDITPAEFNRMLRGELPPATTSAPSPGAYKETFQELCAEGYEVICISPARAVTRMCETAILGRRLAHEEGVEERIEVFDSGTAAMGQGFLVLEAARMAQEGAKMDQIAGRLRALSDSVFLLATLDTLEYLSKTARLPRLGSLFGQALQIKPIILFARGTVKPLKNPRTRQRAVGLLLDLMEERLQGGLPLRVAVQHADAREEAEALKGAVGERFRPEELLISEFSPVMTSYTGSGLLGLAFYEDPDSSREGGRHE
jgi:DegV family protein with EDD domain